MIRQEKLVESLKEIADGVVTFRDTDRFYDPISSLFFVEASWMVVVLSLQRYCPH